MATILDGDLTIGLTVGAGAGLGISTVSGAVDYRTPTAV